MMTAPSAEGAAITPPYQTLEVAAHDTGVTVITLSRPERLNAISVTMILELIEVLERLADDLDQRVVILTGAGRAFCAGTDLHEGVDVWSEQIGQVQARIRLQEHLARIPTLLREIPQPVIAAIHGPAAGGGMSFAAACDLRVVDPTARFNAAFVRIGLSGGDAGASWTLPRLVGLSRAAELLYTGRFFDAEEALRIGFATRLVPDGQHLSAAHELAGELLRNSPLGIRMTKTLLAATFDAPSIRTHLELENRTQILCTLTDDFAEGAAAFRERRDPDYRDR